MFFDGGISGFFDDLYYGAVEKGYKLTHPRSWDCVLKSQAEAMEDDDDEYENIIRVLQSIGIEDEELFGLIEEAGDMDKPSREEAESLMKRLREKKVSVDFSKFAETLENDRKERVSQKSEDLEEIISIVGKRWNPYDTFPEEKKYFSIGEIMEIMQRVCYMAEKTDLSEE